MLRLPVSVCLLFPFVTSAAIVGDYDSRLPLVLDGAGWSTELTLINMGEKDANIDAVFATAKGQAEEWKLGLKASAGLAGASAVRAAIPPGGALVITTDGAPEKLTRGYLALNVFNGMPVAGSALLNRRQDGKIVQSLRVPLSPESERRSVLPIRMDADSSVELALVSETSYTRVDFIFRNPAGVVVYNDAELFDGATQIFVPLRDLSPKLQDFQGTVEWTVSWPGADIYEYQYLSAVAIVSRAGSIDALQPPMTLQPDQTRARRH